MSRSSGSPSRLLALLLGLAFALVGPTAAAQQPELDSHQVNPDHSVTFRYYAPTAKSVTVAIDYDHRGLPLRKGADGVWTLTTGPLAPSFHSYGLSVDGVQVYDPFNAHVDFSYGFRTNSVWIHGSLPQLWDDTGVLHGVVHYHRYRSAIIRGAENAEEQYLVYTPPGYNPAGRTRYPVLYLLHGWSADFRSWVDQGQANFIMDNLIAQRKAVPMIVVMPQGYGAMSFVLDGFGVWSDPAKVAENIALFQGALLKEIIPQIKAQYRVFDDPAHRAIAGLSMGGGQSLIVGLNHPGTFSWIGGFSPALLYPSFDGLFPDLIPHGPASPKLLWISCGTEDDLIGPTRRFVAWLRADGLRPTAIETPGIHNWPVWRNNLIHFAPLLFGGGTGS